MFERKKDLKDQLIEILRQDKERLELRVAELTNQLIALTSRAAYRELHPREPLATKDKPVAFPIDPRREIYKPKVSYSDVAEEFARREQEL